MSKEKKIRKKEIIEESATDEVKKLATILVTIVGIVCIFYIITVFVTKRNGDLQYSVQDEISEISYDTILASEITLKKGSYYVLIYERENPYTSLFKSYLSKYTALEKHDMVYFVDLNDALNQKYRGDSSSYEAPNLAFNKITLLKMQDGNIENVYDDEDSIELYLKNLITTT